MEKNSKLKVRSTNAQLRVMVDYMNANPDLERMKAMSPYAAKQLDNKWTKLAEILAESGPRKSVEQWKYTWRDLKKKARYEYSKAQTGNNVMSITDFISELSQNVMEAVHNAETYNPDEIEVWRQNRLWIEVDPTLIKENPTFAKVKEESAYLAVEYLENEDDCKVEEVVIQEEENGNDDDVESDTNQEVPQRKQATSTKHIGVPPNLPPLKKRPSLTYQQEQQCITRKPTASSPPTQAPAENDGHYDHLDILNTLNRFIDYEKEREKLAHEREMTRIKQVDKMLSVFEKVTEVVEDLTPSIINYLERDDDGYR